MVSTDSSAIASGTAVGSEVTIKAIPSDGGLLMCKLSYSVTNTSMHLADSCGSTGYLTKFIVYKFNELCQAITMMLCDLDRVDELILAFDSVASDMEQSDSKEKVLAKLQELQELRDLLDNIRGSRLNSLGDKEDSPKAQDNKFQFPGLGTDATFPDGEENNGDSPPYEDEYAQV